MKVSELGEFGLIDLLARMISDPETGQLTPNQTVIGIGDDAAAWQSDASTRLATVDSMIQDVHFSLDITTWKELGWKSLAINLSDIAAMGGVPEYALIALALPGDTDVADVTELYKGMLEAAEQSETAIIGGNTCGSPVVSITVTVIGDSLNNRVLRRSTARPGDTIAVTGYPGNAAAGHVMLKDKLQFEAEIATYLRNAFLHPKPRVEEGQLLLKHGVATAIDISDGLLADLRHICKASQVSACIEVEKLPIHADVQSKFGEKALELALGGGEDYELIFTASEEIVGSVQTAMECPVTIIGKITEGEAGKIDLLDAEGNTVTTDKSGWEHF